MRTLLFLVLFAVAVGCSTTERIPTGRDVCEVHHVRMRVMTVPHIWPSPVGPELYSAMVSSFPHTLLPGPQEIIGADRERVFICPRCVEARDEWYRQHPLPK